MTDNLSRPPKKNILNSNPQGTKLLLLSLPKIGSV